MDNVNPMPGMIATVRKYMADGWEVGILSNQYGISSSSKKTTHVTHDYVQTRFAALQDMLECTVAEKGTVSFMYASHKDRYRKPMTGMYDLFMRGRKAHDPASFYCGDALGRGPSVAEGRPKADFSVGDFNFAKHCGLRPLVPPTMAEASDADVMAKFLPKLDIWGTDWHCDIDMTLPDDGRPLAITMVGFPGCGKSTLTKALVGRHAKLDFVVLNNDTQKLSKPARIKLLKSSIASKRSYIDDNTNGPMENRLAPAGYHAICFYFAMPKELASHLRHMRAQLGGTFIPAIAANMFQSKLVVPADGKNGIKVRSIPGIPDFHHPPPEFFFRYDIKV
jgi:DNA 3'-phosphatase